MADADAERLVNELKAAGWTGKQIGQAIGRDPSLVNQIGRGARGAGYGSQAVPALQQLAQGATRAELPRRQTAEGTQARVRRPVVRTPAGSVASGRTFGTVMRRELDAAASQGRNVNIELRTRDGKRATAWRKGGFDAAALQRAIAEMGGFEAAVRGLDGVAYLEEGDKIASIDMTVQ